MTNDRAQTSASTVSWEDFRQWALKENEYQKKISGVHAADHAAVQLRGRTYFEVNVYRLFHAMQVCFPYLNRPNQKIMDVGSWPGAWLRAIAHFAAKQKPEVWASGLIFPDNFVELMEGACKGIQKIELDVWSPMYDREAPNVFVERGYSFVSAMEVVEHLYHPGWMLKAIHEAMAPGGILFLTTNNVARLENLYGLLKGGGLAGNLDQLLPRGGGILGAWRPHAREYAWQELNHAVMQAGFVNIAHGFYSENYSRYLIEGRDMPSEELAFENDEQRRFAEAVKPLLHEPEQLKSGMYLLFQRI